MLIPETEIVITKDGVEWGRTIVRPGDYVIGCDEGADIVIADPLLSPRHAQLTVNYHELFIEDLGSVNGTFVAGNPVNGCTRVWPHQKLQLGPVVLETRRLKTSEDAGESLAPETATLRRMLPEEFLRDHRYEISGIVARGGMGAILGAQELTIDRKVAMKVMLSAGTESDLLRFVTEAKITGKLEHPNIVPVHELGVDEQEQVFYTMKFVEGKTLRKVLELLREGFPGVAQEYPLTILLTIFQKICDAIAFAHSRGVIHRDLKPDNVMLGTYGEVLVMDWGLAKVRSDLASVIVPLASVTEPASSAATPADPSSSSNDFTVSGRGPATLAGTILGTPQYMSPEQAEGAVEALDERTDIYALGAILYQILALRPPIQGHGKAEILENVRAGRIEPLRSSSRHHDPEAKGARTLHHLPGGRIPASLGAVAMKALAHDPTKRYPAVQDLQAEITRFQSGFATAAEGAGLLKQIGLLVGRHQREAAILCASIVVLLGLGFAAFTHISNERNIATRERARAEEQRHVAEAERSRAEMERERTQEALAYLQKSAPAYHGQARVLVDEQKFDEAIQKIEFALQLSPENVDYHLFRAHTLEAMQRLPEAIEAYRRVLALRPNDASAKMNLALCEQLVRENGGPLPLTPTRQAQLLDAIVSQKRSADSVLIARALGREAEVAIARIRTRLKSVMAQEKWNDSRIQNSPDGTCALNLSDLSVPDLSILRDLPIAALQIANCGARDLAPLATLRLRELNIDGLQIRDLSPLKGMALQKLSMRDTPVDTLQPVAGMPLRELTITRTLVTELAPLRGMQLRSFAADGVPVRNLAVVQGMPIETLSLRGCGLDVIGAVAWMPLRTLNLADNPISDLSPLSGCSKLRSLILSNTNVRDLRPINALKLDELHLSGTQVVDLLPLRAMPLRQLTVDHAPLADASQLLACTSLEDLAISPGAPNVSALRRLPRLTYISEEWSERDKRAAQRTTDFWRQFDASAPDRETEAKFTSALAGIRLLAGWRESRIEKKADGTYRLDLHKLPINDLSALRGLPISDLDISSTGATQLGPLAKCPLRVLVCYMTSVQDLAPLSGMALEKFDGGDTKINDVRPLRKMPMRWLSLRTTQVSDISPLEGMPLQVVNLGDLKGVTDLKWIQNAALKELDADHTGISDLNAIAGCTLLEKLNCSFTGVSDLRPLVGKKLSILYAAGIKIRNIDVLRGMPLRTLHIDYTEVADLGPLAECKSLEELLIPTTARDVASLRPLSNLRRVSYRRGSNGHAPAQTPAEFWAELDSKTPPGTSPQVAAGISPAWGDSYQYDTGISPAVATNAGRQGPDSSSGRGSIRLALAVHQTEAGAGPLIYRLGRFNGLRVEWGEALRIQPLGARPAISFAGDDVLLVYQAAAGVSPLFYRLGQVTSSRARPTHIAWGDQIRFDAGGAHPSVAMWRNTAVCVQQAREGVGPLTYRVGRIAGARIDWGESVQYETNAIQPAVAIAGNRVVAVHQSEAGVGPLWLRTGQITGTRIQWSEPSTYESAGLRPAVGLNGNDLVAVQQLGTLVSPVSCRVARFNGDRLAWDNPLHIEMTAAEPAVAMGDETIIVVQQAEPAGVGPLWYRLASYRGTSAGVPTP